MSKSLWDDDHEYYYPLVIKYAWKSLSKDIYGEDKIEKEIIEKEMHLPYTKEWRDNFEKEYAEKHNNERICIIYHVEVLPL